MNMEQPEGLLSVLRDSSAPYGDRSDAAIDLAAFDEQAVRATLGQLAAEESTDRDLAEDCAESLAQIWCRLGRIDTEIFERLRGSARGMAKGVIEAYCPKLLDQPSICEGHYD